MAMGRKAGIKRVWLGMKWNGTLMTDIQGNALTYSKWKEDTAPPAPKTANEQCLHHWIDSGNFIYKDPCDSAIVFTMCV